MMVLALLGAAFGFAMLWLGRGGGGSMTIPIPIVGSQVKIVGSVTGGAICLAFSLAVIATAVDLVRIPGSTLQYQELQGTQAAPSNSWLPIVALLAQGPQASPDGPDTWVPSEIDSGWVYLGRERTGSTEWTFESVESPATDQWRPAIGDQIRANRSMLIRSDHYSALSGTILGKFLRVDEPPAIAVIPRGSCAGVLNQEQVGVSAIWLEIQYESCDDGEAVNQTPEP